MKYLQSSPQILLKYIKKHIQHTYPPTLSGVLGYASAFVVSTNYATCRLTSGTANAICRLTSGTAKSPLPLPLLVFLPLIAFSTNNAICRQGPPLLYACHRDFAKVPLSFFIPPMAFSTYVAIHAKNEKLRNEVTGELEPSNGDKIVLGPVDIVPNQNYGVRMEVQNFPGYRSRAWWNFSRM